MSAPPSLRVLYASTKCPWPPIDGGRLVLLETLKALLGAGIRASLVCPPPLEEGAGPGELEGLHTVWAPGRKLPWLLTLLRPYYPATVARHASATARAGVLECLRSHRPDVGHAEQLHTIPNLRPAIDAGIPTLLRAQNVESDLWKGAAAASGLGAPWLRYQARQIARFEAASTRRLLTVAIADTDAERLRSLAGEEGRVTSIPAPFPAELPARTSNLDGDPSVVIVGGGWVPNSEGARWFLSSVWPEVHARLPGARLHLFADEPVDLPPGCVLRAQPANSEELFPIGSILAVPLRIASGVRMKILEAWARGVPVVATPEAARGLEARNGEEFLVASSPEGFAEAIGALSSRPELRAKLAAAGRALLRRRHDPARVAKQWLEIYQELAATGRPQTASKTPADG